VLDSKPARILLPRFSGRLKGAITQTPQALGRALPRGNPRHIMTQILHKCDRGVVECILETDLGRNQLVVDPRLCQGIVGRQSTIKEMEQVLDGRSYDTGPSRGADGDVYGWGLKSATGVEWGGPYRRRRPMFCLGAQR